MKQSETIWNNLKHLKKSMSTLLLPAWIPRCFLLDAPSLPFTARAGDESRVSCPAAGVNSNQGVLCQDLSDRAQYLEIIVSSSGKLAELHSYLVKPWKIIHSVRWSCPTNIKNCEKIDRGYWMIPISSHRKNVYQPCGYESKPSYPGEPQNFVKQVSTPIPILFLEVVRMISYDFIYLIKVCEDVFNVFTHIHSVAVLQSANLESPTARWWQRKGRAGSFQGAQRVGLFQTCSIPKWSCFDHSNGRFIWVLYGFWSLGDPFQTIQNGTWRHGLLAGLAVEFPRAPAPASHRRPAGRWKLRFWWSKSWYSWYNDTIWYH